MTRESLINKLNLIFCKDYQSVLLIHVNDLTMEIFSADEEKSIPDSIDIVSAMKTYDTARSWYIDNYVVENHRRRLTELTRMENICSHISGGEPYYIEYGRVKDGEINYNQLCYAGIENDEGDIEYITLGFRNIDVRKQAEIDDLTGILTRFEFFRRAEELLLNHPEEQFDIMISDIVDFKKVNEIYGIKTADKILRWVGTYLTQYMSDNFLIGRYGGDQMVMLGLHEELAKHISEKGRKEYIWKEKNNGLPDVITKFGIYENIPHDQSVISSCDKAHVVLNSIKHHYVKDAAFYNKEYEEQYNRKRRIEKCMYDSLANGDFKVYYQPKHDARTGKLVGAEALVRWIHPEYGFMSPADFIPLFEQNGFIVENDRYVWKKTCENLKRWEEMGIQTVPISVNASKLTMSNIDIAKDMKIPVKENGINPNQLHIEITETLMAENMDELVERLNNIREVGFEIELDDFGAGYSSINILSTLPLDVVKLDMSFMQHFGDEKRAKVLAACINLAKELGFKTVSEGVEHREQNEVLGKLGVDMIQGYYYSKPLPEDEFEKYMMVYQEKQ